MQTASRGKPEVAELDYAAVERRANGQHARQYRTGHTSATSRFFHGTAKLSGSPPRRAERVQQPHAVVVAHGFEHADLRVTGLVSSLAQPTRSHAYPLAAAPWARRTSRSASRIIAACVWDCACGALGGRAEAQGLPLRCMAATPIAWCERHTTRARVIHTPTCACHTHPHVRVSYTPPRARVIHTPTCLSVQAAAPGPGYLRTEEPADNIRRTRTYDLYITYDQYYQVGVVRCN